MLSEVHAADGSAAEPGGAMSSVVLVRRCAVTAALTVVAGLAVAASARAAASPPVWGPSVAYGVPSAIETAFESISCVSVGNCVAVGVSERSLFGPSTAVVAAESSGTWGPTATVTKLPAGANTSAGAIVALGSVSCTSATSCVAVGEYQNAAGGIVPMEVPLAVSGSDATPGAAVQVALPAGAVSATAATQAAVLDGV